MKWMMTAALSDAALHAASLPDAAMNSYRTGIRILIHAGANVQAVNRFGITQLSLACSNANAVMIRLLLAAKADPDFTGPAAKPL
jgi:ankyrin repeat protein